MKVRLKKLSEDAQLPKKSKEGDFCYDVVAVSEKEVSPNVWQYGLGFAYEIDRENFDRLLFASADERFRNGYLGTTQGANYNVSIDLRPRSGIFKTGMVLANSVGTFK